MHVLEAQRAIADRDGVAYMSLTLASVALTQDDLGESHRRLVECLTVAAEVGFLEVTGYALGVAAAVAPRAGRSRRRSAPGRRQPGELRANRVVTSLRERLEDADAATERGRTMGAEAATAVAFALGSRLDPDRAAEAGMAPPPGSGG